MLDQKNMRPLQQYMPPKKKLFSNLEVSRQDGKKGTGITDNKMQ